MRISFSLTESIGVKGAAIDKETKESIIAYLVIPDGSYLKFKKNIEEVRSFAIMEDTINKGVVKFDASYIEAERKVDGLYKGHQVLLVSKNLNFKNAAKKQYFLLSKKDKPMEEEEIIEELKTQFFEKALKTLPLPIKKEWEGFIWSEISRYFNPEIIVGDLPYEKVYSLEFPSVSVLEELVEFSHKSFEFKKYFKRVPQLKGIVMGVNDIQHFSFKDWNLYLEGLGGIELFRELPYVNQVLLVNFFEIFGVVPNIQESAEAFMGADLKRISILLRNTNDKNRKNQIKALFKNLVEMATGEHSGLLFSFVNNFEGLLKAEEVNIRNRNIEPIITWLNSITYSNVEVGAEALAEVCSKAKISEYEYEKFESQYLTYLDKALYAPRTYPTIHSELGKNSWELLDMTVPRAWIVGVETHCCMVPSNVGGACLLYAARNPETSGILRIFSKGKTVAQSFMWLSEPDRNGYRTMVLDNIEVNGRSSFDEIKEGSSHSFVIDCYKDFAERIGDYAKLFRIKAITVGTGYTEIDMSLICSKKLEKQDNLYAVIPPSLNYSDAGVQWLLKEY